jgi:hypothetical protein
MKGHVVATIVAALLANIAAACGGSSSLPSGPSPQPAPTGAQPSPTATTMGVLISVNPSTVAIGAPASFVVTVTGERRVGGLGLNFGDGAILTLGGIGGEARLGHVFKAAGMYVVTATATDSSGQSSSASATVTVI